MSSTRLIRRVRKFAFIESWLWICVMCCSASRTKTAILQKRSFKGVIRRNGNTSARPPCSPARFALTFGFRALLRLRLFHHCFSYRDLSWKRNGGSPYSFRSNSTLFLRKNSLYSLITIFPDWLAKYTFPAIVYTYFTRRTV